MYDELIKRLRTHNGWSLNKTLDEAADAIEELTGFVQEAERDRDEYRERLDKANDAIEELNKPKWVPVTERLPKLGERVIVWYLWHDDVNCSVSLDEMIMSDRTMKPKWRKHHWQDHVTHWMPLPKPPKESEP